MDSIGTINTSYIVEYDKNCENYQNLDNKFIVKVKSSNLNDVIILFKESNFDRFIREASNCFIVCVKFESNEEDEDDDDEYTAMRLAGTFKADRLIILELNQNLWLKKCLQKKFSNLNSPIMRKYYQLLEDINYEGNFLNTHLELLHSKYHIGPGTEDFVIKIIKLFKFKNQKEVDEELFEMAIKQKCSFEVIQSMIDFHKDSSNGISKHDALFLAKGIKVFNEEIIQNYKQELTKEDKEKTTDEIEKFHSNKDSLLLHVCSRSRIALIVEEKGDEQLQKIEEYYRNLIDLNLDSVSNLLKIVDHKLLIIFDFDSDSIERSYLMGSRHNRGIFDQDRMRIYIGAKNSNNPSSHEYINRHWEIIGILIHEICHYVNFKVFNNNCKPYQKDDANIQEYERIVNEYKSWIDHHEIVGRVFSNYEETMWHAELIVRVVQMIVTYKVLNSKHLKSLEEKYQSLFSYFNNTVMPQIKEYLDPDNQIKRQIKEVSSFRLNQFEIKPVKQIINFDEEKYIHFMESNSLKLAMAMFCLNFADDFAIFTTFTDLMDEFKGNEVLQLWSSDWRIKIVIFCDQINESSKFDECIKKLDNSDRLNQIFIIFEEQSQNIKKLKLKFTKKIENLENMNFNFTSLTEESKDLILQRDVIFQGNQTTLNKIITKDSKAAQFLPINHLLESSDPIVIGRLPEKNTDYDDKMFIERKLTHKIKNQVKEFSTENMDDIVKLLSTKKYIIISDEVGKGKSTLMTYLAYRFLQTSLPHTKGKFFVVKINLHQHSKVLARFKDDSNLESFIYEYFINNSKFTEFEWNIFEDYYQKGKLVLMLDGFDEIAPNCEQQTFAIILKIVNTMASNVIVATRPLFAEKLKISNFFILNLELLTDQNQLGFLTNFLMSQTEIVELYSATIISDLCKKLLFRIQISVKESFDNNRRYTNPMMSFPLHLKMFADVISNNLLQNKSNFEEALNSITLFNVYDLYDDFFGIKQDIALKDKGEIVENDIKDLERRGFKRLQLFECAGKLAWNTLHPAYKTNPIEITEKEMKYLQRYGIVTMQNNEIYFIHRSYGEFLMAHMFLKNIIDGTLSSSNFEKDHFWIDILTLVEHEKIKKFIDRALTKKSNYNDISEDNLQQLGKFVIKEFKHLEGNDKNFLHCIVEHAKKYSIRSLGERDFVFISHLLFDSLMYCNSDEEITCIKNIIEMPWDESSELRFDPSSGKNIFHLCCELGVSCLVSVIWKLAEKVYGHQVKDYFFINSSYHDNKVVKVLDHALQIHTLFGKTVKNIRNCRQIEELRELNYIDDNEFKNVNDDCNFEQSTPNLLIQLVKKLNLSENELELVCPEVYKGINHYHEKNIFFNLNFYLNFILSFFPPGHPKNENYLVYKVCKLTSYFIKDINENIEENIEKVLNFLEGKLYDQFELFMIQLFALSFQSDWKTFVWKRYLTETKARILYSKLKEVDFKKTDINLYFQYYPYFFSSYFSDKEKYCLKTFRHDLEMFFNILDEEHLIFLLLNEGFEGFNIIIQVVSKFQIECLEHLLNLLKNRFTDKEKLYFIVDKSKILFYSGLYEEKFQKVFEFCETNFEKQNFLNLLFTVDGGCKLILENTQVCNTIINHFLETFDDEKWKIFFWQVNQNNATIILFYLNYDWIDSAKILIQVAKQKLTKVNFFQLIHFQDKDDNSIASIKNQKNLHDIDTSISICSIL